MRLYLRYFSIHLRSAMQYKASFYLTAFGQFLSTFSAFLSVYFLMDRFHSVEGFSLGEVMLCFGVMNAAFSLAECFARGFDAFPAMLGNGAFDRILLRPRGAVFQVLASQMEFTRLGRVLQAAAVLCAAVPASGVKWTPARALTLFLMLAGGTALFAALFLLNAALSFFTTEALEVVNIFTDGGREFGKYPAAIYGAGVLRVLTVVVPLALVQYYPLLFLLGRADGAVYMLSPLGALLFYIPCLLLWRLGLRRFRSTGS